VKTSGCICYTGQGGSIGGVIVIIAAAYSIFASWKLRKAWKEYQQTGSFTV